jgi:probable F420-dependent oxidoreductase
MSLKIDVRIAQDISIKRIGELSNLAEKSGFECIWFAETSHDPFLPVAIAGEHTDNIMVGTSIALAFPRSPMSLAYTAWDLQRLLDGRFILGLGTQVKGHIERRFGIKWESPVEKLREVIEALRAIWKCWQNNERLNFRGKYFTINLMTPFFDPGPIPNPDIPIHIAGVNISMCRLAGEICDGFHIHPLHSIDYIKNIVIPGIEKGARKVGRKKRDVELFASVFIATGDTEKDIEKEKEDLRQQIAFYSSTRTYKKVLELHGWGEVVDRLHKKSLKGDWKGMAREITDEMLETFVVTGGTDEIISELKRRYSGIVDRVAVYRSFEGELLLKSM